MSFVCCKYHKCKTATAAKLPQTLQYKLIFLQIHSPTLFYFNFTYPADSMNFVRQNALVIGQFSSTSNYANFTMSFFSGDIILHSK